MAGSIIASFKALLLAQMQAASSLNGLQITYGDPGEAMRRESIFLGDVDSGTQTPESFSTGARRRVEDFTVDVILAIQSKPTPQTAEARALVLVNAVEQILVDSPQLGGSIAALQFCEVEGMSMTTNQADQPNTVCTIRIHAKARLA